MSDGLEFLTNTPDPEDPKAQMHLAVDFHEWGDPQGRERAWQRHLEYLSDKVIGDPQGTEKHTVEELKAMGMVGIYRRTA